MAIDTLIKLFEDYGWPGVAAIVIILFIYFFVTKTSKKQSKELNSGLHTLAESLSTTISNQNEKLIHTLAESNEKSQERLMDIVMHALQKHDNKNESEHQDSLDARRELGKFVDEVLFDMLNILNAQRTFVIEFHNSKENTDGLAFLWYDIQYEKQQKGIDPLSNRARNLQATNLRPIIERVNKAPGHIIVLDKADIENIYNESTVLYAHFAEIDAEHLVYCGIYNQTTHQLIGLLGIEYQRGYPFHDDLIDNYTIKEKVALIEHKYNDVSSNS